MPTFALLEKVYAPFSPKAFEPTIQDLCKGLRVNLRVIGKTTRGWILTKIFGEDETAALRLLDQKIGIAPVSVDKLRRFSNLKGKVFSSRPNKNELLVDVGIFSPKICDVTIGLRSLRGQLADGKKLTLRRLIELFALNNNLPLRVRILTQITPQKQIVEGEFSDIQLSQNSGWIRSNLDRLLVVGAPLSIVERAIKLSKHSRDVIRIEQLGFLEQAIICKLGTDAVGLIPKLGPLLPTAIFSTFLPRKISLLTDSPLI